MNRASLTGLVATALGAACLLAVNLDGYPLWNPDEAKHAEIAREMLVTGRWIEPLVNFEPYHHKLSPFYLLVGLAYRLLGVGELAARLVPALACFATFLLTYRYSSRRSVEEGLLAALLLGSSGLFVYLGRFTSFDALLTCLVTASALIFARAAEQRVVCGSILPAYVFGALAVLVKGPVAAVLLAVPVGLAWSRGRLTREVLRPGVGLAVAAGIVAVWVVPAALAAPDYLADFVWVHNVERYLWSSSAENLFHPEPLWFFVPVVLVALLPWSPLLPVTVTASLQERGGDRLLAEYVVWVLVFFSLSSGKLATYVVPAFPAAAILTARWLVERRIDDRLAGRTLARVGAGLTAPLVIAAAVAIHDRAPSATFHAASLLPASAAGLVVAIAGRRFTTTVAAVTVVSWGLVATLFVFSVWSAPALSAHMSDRDLAHAARAAGPADAVVAYRVRPFSFLFYYRERLVYYVPVDEYRQALFTPGRVLVLTEDRWRPHLEAIAPGVELREIARNSIHVLYGADNP